MVVLLVVAQLVLPGIAAQRLRSYGRRLGRVRAAVTVAVGAVTLASLSDLRRRRHVRRIRASDPRER